jgi:hypothetical protein
VNIKFIVLTIIDCIDSEMFMSQNIKDAQHLLNLYLSEAA